MTRNRGRNGGSWGKTEPLIKVHNLVSGVYLTHTN